MFGLKDKVLPASPFRGVPAIVHLYPLRSALWQHLFLIS
jgi:hypothetical protein